MILILVNVLINNDTNHSSVMRAVTRTSKGVSIETKPISRRMIWLVLFDLSELLLVSIYNIQITSNKIK